jgi:hypothetical protein
MKKILNMTPSKVNNFTKRKLNCSETDKDLREQ